jgi:hypothetical protein
MSLNRNTQLKAAELSDTELGFINIIEINKCSSNSSNKISGFDKEKLLQMANFSKLSSLTFNEENQRYIEMKLANKGYKTFSEFEQEGYKIIPFSTSYDHAGYLFIKDKEVTIAYHGTKTLGDLLTDINAILIPSSFVPGRAHLGFHNGFTSSWDDIYIKLNEYAKEQNISVKDFHFNVTGHSMGGAIAKIAAIRLEKIVGANEIKVATFGDPRVFDVIAADNYNKTALVDTTIRVTEHHSDLIPALCPGVFGYSHVGKNLRIKCPDGNSIHDLDGYYEAIKNHSDDEFQANNEASIFYYPSKFLQYANAYTIGNIQQAISYINNTCLGESSFIEHNLE